MTGEPAGCLIDRLLGQPVISVVGYHRDEDNADSDHHRKGQDRYDLPSIIVHVTYVSAAVNLIAIAFGPAIS
jgi:hypothetical protein